MADDNAKQQPAPAGDGNGTTTDDNFWGDLLTKLNTSSRDFIFTKEAKTRVRLVAINPKNRADCFRAVDSVFRGKTRTKYLVLAYKPGAELEEGESPIKALVLSKTAFTDMVTLQAEGHDFFNPDNGYGITILKNGSGQQTKYTVTNSPKPVPVPADVREALKEANWDTFVNAWNALQARKAAGGNGDEDGGGDEEALATEMPMQRGRGKRGHEDTGDW